MDFFNSNKVLFQHQLITFMIHDVQEVLKYLLLEVCTHSFPHRRNRHYYANNTHVADMSILQA